MIPKVGYFEKVPYEQFKADYKVPADFPEERIREIYDNIKLPKRSTSGSLCYDFFAPFYICLHPNESVVIPTGIRVIPDEGWGLLLYPRSGQGFKFRLQLDNTVGVIDTDYYGSDNSGHIMAKVTNDSREEKTCTIDVGKGFMQGMFTPYGITYDDDADGVRNGGFGSTDKT